MGKHLVKPSAAQMSRHSRKHQGSPIERARSNDSQFMACTKKRRRHLAVQDDIKLIELSMSLNKVKEENIARLDSETRRQT